MKIIYKLTGGFLIVSLLIALTGFVAMDAAATTKSQVAIVLASKNMVINILEDEQLLHDYLLTENPAELANIRVKTERADELAKMWISVLISGSESDEFQSSDSYQMWMDGGFATTIGTVPYDPEVSAKAEELKQLRDEAEEGVGKLLEFHDQKLDSMRLFAESYNEEKVLRYAMTDTVQSLNDADVNRILGNMIYHSKEALFQYKDEAHTKDWKDDIEELESALTVLVTQDELDALDFDGYMSVADMMGDLTLLVVQRTAEERFGMERFREYILTIEDKIAEETALTISKMSDVRADVRNVFISMSFAIFLLAILMGFIISRRIIRPIKELALCAKQMRKGNLNNKCEVQSRDEIGELAETFENMRLGLKDRNDLLESLLDTFKGKFGNVATILARQNVADLVKDNPRVKDILPKSLRKTVSRKLLTKEHSEKMRIGESYAQHKKR